MQCILRQHFKCAVMRLKHLINLHYTGAMVSLKYYERDVRSAAITIAGPR